MEMDEQMMREGLKEARAAREEGEVPIGAVVAAEVGFGLHIKAGRRSAYRSGHCVQGQNHRKRAQYD